MTSMRVAVLALTLILGGTFLVTGCSGIESKAEYPTRRAGDQEPVYNNKRPSIFGGEKSGIGLFSSKKDTDNVASGIAVNAYLWRASLDTLSFMPIANADPFGGTIITDWYNPAETPGERVKINVFILGRALRSDGLKVSVFRQLSGETGWMDADISPQTVTDLENTILTRARQLRVDTINK